MVKRNGGYAIVVHDDANIYNEVKSAYESHKPILFYDDDNTCYFIDTVKYGDDNDLIMTKGGKTFTVTTNNTLSSEGEIQPQGSGGKKLYYHSIQMYNEAIDGEFTRNTEIYFSIITDTSIAFTGETLFDYLYGKRQEEADIYVFIVGKTTVNSDPEETDSLSYFYCDINDNNKTFFVCNSTFDMTYQLFADMSAEDFIDVFYEI